MIKSDIIIVTYNAMPYIQKCIDSCRGHKLIVVDNNSTDGTVAYIRDNFPNTHLIPQSKNLGFGQANNLGIRHALEQGAEYVFLLNQDAYLQTECIEALIEVQKQNLAFGILSPIHLNGKGTKLDQNFSNYVAHKNNAEFYSDFVLKKSLQQIYEVPFVNAAGWLLSKQILETVGGFDPMFFHYGEDDNYCQRAEYHGFKVGVVPTAFLLHDREDRITPQIGKGSTQYFERKERSLKLKYGNINLENLTELTQIKSKFRRNIRKAYIKFNQSQATLLQRELDLIKKILPEIAASRKQNSTSGKTYL